MSHVRLKAIRQLVPDAVSILEKLGHVISIDYDGEDAEISAFVRCDLRGRVSFTVTIDDVEAVVTYHLVQAS